MKALLAPRINVNDADMAVVHWRVEDGDWVDVGQDIVDVETSKAVVEIASEHSGYIVRACSEQDRIKVGEVLATFHASVAEMEAYREEADRAVSAADPRTGDAAQVAGAASVTRFSARALHLLQDAGIAPEDFPGSGLVTLPMVEEFLAHGASGAKSPQPADADGGHLRGLRRSSVSLSKQVEIEALSVGAGGNITSTLSFTFASAPLRAHLEAEGHVDGMVLPVVLCELARMLPRWPQMTAFFADDAVYYHDRADIGFALDMGDGLKVVTLDASDTPTPDRVFEKMLDIGQRYLENRLDPGELVNSTFTVTDLSGLDVHSFVPLINGRQSAILGIGGDSRLPGHPMTFNLTFDHRVLTGREVAIFMRELVESLEAYYEPGAGDEPVPQATSQLPLSEGTHCDRCFVDTKAYHEEYGKDAFMQIAMDEDSRLIRVCHRCASGY